MVLTDVGEHPDVGADDHPLADLLVLGLERHALDDQGLDLRAQVVLADLDLLEDRRRSPAVDRLVDAVLVDHGRERPGRLGDGDDPRLAHHPGDDPGHGRFAPDPVHVDAPLQLVDPPPMGHRLCAPPRKEGDADGNACEHYHGHGELFGRS
jgi:hypothetical protein